MTFLDTLAGIRHRIGLVLLMVLVALVVALPIALTRDARFESSVTASVPPDPPFRLGVVGPAGRTSSILGEDVVEYMGGPLVDDVATELDVDAEILSIDGSRSQDGSSYELEVSAKQPKIAERAAGVAGRLLVKKGNELSNDLIDRVTERLGARLDPLEVELQEDRALEQRLLAQIDEANQERELVSQQIAIQDRIGGADEDLRAQLDDLNDQIQQLQASLGEIRSELEIKINRRLGYADLAREVETYRITREASSMIIDGPTAASSTKVKTVLLTEAAAVIAGLVAGLGVAFLLERRRAPAARRAAP